MRIDDDPDVSLLHSLFGPEAAETRARLDAKLNEEIDEAASRILGDRSFNDLGGLSSPEAELLSRDLADEVRRLLAAHLDGLIARSTKLQTEMEKAEEEERALDAELEAIRRQLEDAERA